MIVMGLDMVGAAMHQRFARGKQAGLHDALGLELLDVVERRAAHDRLLPGHHRHSHGNDRQPDARANSVHPRPAASARRPSGADRRRRSGTSASRSTTRCTANYAIFDLASRYRETFLYDKYLMAKHAIEEGNHDNWTISGKRIAEAEAALNGGSATQAARPPAADEVAVVVAAARRRAAPAAGSAGRRGRKPARRSAVATATSKRRCTRTTTCSTRKTSAIRAATSFRRISRTSSRRSSS